MMPRDEGHKFARSFRHERGRIEARMEQMRRARNTIAVVAAAISIWTLIFAGWLLLHPEQIGSYVGRVVAGFEEASS